VGDECCGKGMEGKEMGMHEFSYWELLMQALAVPIFPTDDDWEVDIPSLKLRKEEDWGKWVKPKKISPKVSLWFFPFDQEDRFISRSCRLSGDGGRFYYAERGKGEFRWLLIRVAKKRRKAEVERHG
jgi:hypothetical protein